MVSSASGSNKQPYCISAPEDGSISRQTALGKVSIPQPTHLLSKNLQMITIKVRRTVYLSLYIGFFLEGRT